jgi:hypothetical protein
MKTITMKLNTRYLRKLNSLMNHLFDGIIASMIAVSFFLQEEIKYVSLIIFGLIGLVRLVVIVYNLFTPNDKNKKI